MTSSTAALASPQDPVCPSTVTLNNTVEKVIHIPDTMATWPWPLKFNPLCDHIAAESTSWLASSKLYTQKSQYSHEKCNFGRLAAYVYPDASREHLRLGNDLFNVLWALDEYTDMEPAAGVRELWVMALDALQNPHKPRPEGETVLGEMYRQFGAKAQAEATSGAMEQFIRDMADCMEGMIQQAEDRETSTIRSVDGYMALRRHDGGVRACFFPGVLHLSIPDAVIEHPVIQELEQCAADLVCLDNDLASYNREQATGNRHWNILTIAMHEFGIDLEGAVKWTVKFHEDIQTRFLDAFARLPTFGPAIDTQVQAYIAHVANWPRGHHAWMMASERYFRKKDAEGQNVRIVPLFANKLMNPERRREKVEVQLVEELEETLVTDAEPGLKWVC